MNRLNALLSIFKKKNNFDTKNTENPPPSELETNDEVINPLLKIFQISLLEQGYELSVENNIIKLSSGINLTIELLETVEFRADSFRTSVKVIAKHNVYFPSGITEFQHSTGQSEEQALKECFLNWAKVDLMAIEDSIKEKPIHCMYIDMVFPSIDNLTSKCRRIILSSVVHYVTNPIEENEDHTFCPCCLFTNNTEAFMAILKSDSYVGIRLFACRDANGIVTADCRVNGEALQLGVESLLEYVTTWSDRGLEFRKQYLIIRTV